MAEKFGNFRWVKEGYLDNRTPGVVVGNMTFAAIGGVDFCLKGDCRGETFGKAFRFHNTQFLEDPIAMERLGDFAVPQIGNVSLISFDPHPLLDPHPYIEWFSERKNHYRIELRPGEAWILSETESRGLDAQSEALRNALMPRLHDQGRESTSSMEWF